MRRWESLPGRAGGQGGRGARHVQVSGVALNTFSLKTINTVDLARTREGCKRGSVQASVHESGPHPRGNQVCTFMLWGSITFNLRIMSTGRWPSIFQLLKHRNPWLLTWDLELAQFDSSLGKHINYESVKKVLSSLKMKNGTFLIPKQNNDQEKLYFVSIHYKYGSFYLSLCLKGTFKKYENEQKLQKYLTHKILHF